ncbi:MAG: DUF4922 domain-containing protein [Bacteroidales bacterium]|nr:DUF4922 domain-containing protein [Bacteroidales bacterium]
MSEIDKFVKDQLSVWPLAAANFRSLKAASSRTLDLGGLEVRVQFNPARIISSTAEVDPASIAARPCFLCPENRPPEQFHIKFEGRKGRCYNVQLNPYPIFPRHLVIARDCHIPQAIWHHLPDMLDFTMKYKDFLVFYNGPKSGASAPDHLHFQACPRGYLPLEGAVDAFLDGRDALPEPLATVKDASLYHFDRYAKGIFALKATTSKSLAKLFYRLLECTPREEGDSEPRFNLYVYSKGEEYRAFVIFRSRIRSHHYYAEGPDHLTMSPGAADMAGVFVAPHKEDYDKLTSEMLREMIDEVTLSAEDTAKICWRLSRKQPRIDIGIMSGEEIVFEIISDGAGPQKVSMYQGRINYNGTLYDELKFDAITRSTFFAEPSFILYGVTIGKGFHWERKVDQQFAGSLRFVTDGHVIHAINRIGIENYLLSVISSEMKSTTPIESLKAHAVISRSWLLTNLRTHEYFDVCADDHCQRYQGLTMAVGDNVRKVIDETWGQVLKYDGSICDTRYSKCCGGTTELFSTCWEDKDYPYLQAVPDRPAGGGVDYCNCSDVSILSRILNDYDLQTRDFYRWEVRYGRQELSDIIRRKSGRDIGTLTALEPLEKGPSGRIKYLRVRGTAGEFTIGKELEIRRILSESHLKSSAFEARFEGEEVILSGHGWGHGVGLCQIGAAVMACQGRNYLEILEHYYPGAQILVNE